MRALGTVCGLFVFRSLTSFQSDEIRLTSRRKRRVQKAADRDIAAVQMQGKKYGYLERNAECVPYCVFGSASTPPRSGLRERHFRAMCALNILKRTQALLKSEKMSDGMCNSSQSITYSLLSKQGA